MNKILMVFVFGLVLVTAQPTNNVTHEKGSLFLITDYPSFVYSSFFLLAECSYEAAIFCLPEILDIVGECVNSPNIEGCIMDALGNDNACIFCICTALELINLSC